MPDITERQRQILELTRAGKSPTEIGTELGISSQAVHNAQSKLRDKNLLEGRTHTRSSTRRARRPNGHFDPSHALEAVREAAEAQIAAAERRQGEIDSEIETLRSEKKTIGTTLTELRKLAPTQEPAPAK